MGYNYSPHPTDEKARQFFGKRGKHIAIVVIIIALCIIFYLTNSAFTSYATYKQELEQQLSDAKASISAVQAEKESCLTSLEATNDSLKICESNLNSKISLLNTCSMEKISLNNSLTNTISSLNTCTTEKDSAIQSSRQLVKNSVKAICCSYGDVQTGSVRNWNIVNDSITCTGGYTVNCTTGETNY